MLRDEQEIDVAIPYSEYSALQQDLRDARAKNQQLESFLTQMKDKFQMQNLAVKQLESNIKSLSRTCIQYSRKILEAEHENQKANEDIQYLKSCIRELQNEKSKERLHFQEQSAKIDMFSEQISHYQQTILTIQNCLSVKVQEVYQLNIKGSEKSKTIRELQQRLTLITLELQEMKNKQGIMVKEGVADCKVLRQKIMELEGINFQLKIQISDLIEKLNDLSSIASIYQKMNQRPQNNIIEICSIVFQKYKQRLIKEELPEQKLYEQMQKKKQSINLALQRQFERILFDN